ncbi:hypothetical protein V6N13_099735 [Hibiscus sabdariffa]
MRVTAGVAILFGSYEGHLTRFWWRPWVHLTGSNAWATGHLKLGLYIGLYRFSNSGLRIDELKCGKNGRIICKTEIGSIRGKEWSEADELQKRQSQRDAFDEKSRR